jgi:hypothetical protein
MPVADDRLRHLRDERLRVAQDKAPSGPSLPTTAIPADALFSMCQPAGVPDTYL